MMMKIKEIEQQITENFKRFKGLYCKIDKRGGDVYSVSAYVYHCINVPKRLLENSDNYPLIAKDIESLVEENKGE